MTLVGDGPPITHGTKDAWTAHHCRCAPCQQWRRRFTRARWHQEKRDGFRPERLPVHDPVPAGPWREHAACANIATTVGSPMDPQRAGEPEDESNARQNRAARDYCDHCPVRQACLEQGTTNKEHGLWGGIVLSNGKPNLGTGGRYALNGRRPAEIEAAS